MNEFTPVGPGIGPAIIRCIHCGNWIPIANPVRANPTATPYPVADPSPYGEADANPYQFKKETSKQSDIVKYFLHGLAFSIIMLAITIGWAVLLVGLMLVGWLIGLLIGLVVLIIIIGYVNVELTGYFWNIYAGTDWMELALHGLVLLLALLLVSIPQLILTWAFHNPIISILLFIPYCFVNGYVAKNVAETWF